MQSEPALLEALEAVDGALAEAAERLELEHLLRVRAVAEPAREAELGRVGVAARDALERGVALVDRVVCPAASAHSAQHERAGARGRTEVLVRERAGVEDEALAARRLRGERGDEGVGDVAHVDVLGRVVVHLVGVARRGQVLVQDLRGQVERLDGLGLRRLVSALFQPGSSAQKTNLMDERLHERSGMSVCVDAERCAGLRRRSRREAIGWRPS